MRNGIPEFRPRKALDRQLSSTTLNDIRRELESLRITRVVNGTFRKLPGGTEIVVAPQRGGGGAPLDRHPFQIASRQNPDNENQYLVTVRPGTINGIIAANWEDSFSVPKEDVRYIVLKCTTNGLVVTSSTLAAENASPASPAAEKWALSAGFDVLIGAVRGASVKQVVFNNLAATGVKRLTTEKSNIEFQQLPYDNWYAWVVT
jgi:hypothetical protein